MSKSAPSSARPHQVRDGILSMLVFTAVFTVMVASGKSSVANYSFVEVVFIRCAVALVVVGVITAFSRGGLAQLKTRRLAEHLKLGTYMTVNLLVYFLALKFLPMNVAVLLSFTSSLFITALSMPMLGEPVGPHRWGAVLVGFAGVAVITGSVNGLLQLGTVLAMASAILSALCWLTVRQMSNTESSLSVTVSMLINTAVLTGIALPWFWTTPEWGDVPVLIVMGVAGGLAQILISHAYRLAPAVIIAPFNYFQLVWSAIFAWIIWTEVPTMRMLAGGALIVAAGLYILYRETRKQKKPVLAPIRGEAG